MESLPLIQDILKEVSSHRYGVYFAVKYGFGINERPWYNDLVLLISIVAYTFVFVAGYKKLGLKFTDRIDDLKTMIDRLG